MSYVPYRFIACLGPHAVRAVTGEIAEAEHGRIVQNQRRPYRGYEPVVHLGEIPPYIRRRTPRPRTSLRRPLGKSASPWDKIPSCHIGDRAARRIAELAHRLLEGQRASILDEGVPPVFRLPVTAGGNESRVLLLVTSWRSMKKSGTTPSWR